MPNIIILIICLAAGAYAGKKVAGMNFPAVFIGLAIGATLAFAIGLREPWYLLALALCGPLLIWRRRTANFI